MRLNVNETGSVIMFSEASLIYDRDHQPIGIHLYPLADEEKKLIQSLTKAKFNTPTIIKKQHPETPTTVSIQITIDREQI